MEVKHSQRAIENSEEEVSDFQAYSNINLTQLEKFIRADLKNHRQLYRIIDVTLIGAFYQPINNIFLPTFEFIKNRWVNGENLRKFVAVCWS